MTAQAMVDLLVYFLLGLWATSVILLIVAMSGYDLPRLWSRRPRRIERSLRLVHYRPSPVRAPAKLRQHPARSRPDLPSRRLPARPRPTHLRVANL